VTSSECCVGKNSFSQYDQQQQRMESHSPAFGAETKWLGQVVLAKLEKDTNDTTGQLSDKRVEARKRLEKMAKRA
jgi:hypothetical protein